MPLNFGKQIGENFWRIVMRLAADRRRLGCLRFILLILLLSGMAVWGAAVFAPRDRFPVILFSIGGLRYWLLPLAGMLAAAIVAARYISDIYELPNWRQGLRQLAANLFFIKVPSVQVDKGETWMQPGNQDALKQIGGPGYVNISPGNLVLLETLDGPSNVYPAGMYYVNRRERVRMVASLEDQHGYIEVKRVTTKDGIEVDIREIRYHYRFKASGRWGSGMERNIHAPFPYSVKAMCNYAYNRNIAPTGPVTLEFMLNTFIDGEISKFIASHRFNDLYEVNNDENDPRKRIESAFSSPGVRHNLEELGIELLWIDIGHFDVALNVWGDRVSSWAAKWQGQNEISRASGEAQRAAQHKIGRAEAQAQVFTQLIQYMESARKAGIPASDLRSLVTLYTIQMLEDLSEPATQHSKRSRESQSDDQELSAGDRDA